jgi:hypothetical protein
MKKFLAAIAAGLTYAILQGSQCSTEVRTQTPAGGFQYNSGTQYNPPPYNPPPYNPPRPQTPTPHNTGFSVDLGNPKSNTCGYDLAC